MEPNRKYTPDIEPDIRPDLRSIPGGGESTPERGNLGAVPNTPSQELADAEKNATKRNPSSNVTPMDLYRRESEGDKTSSDNIKSSYTGEKSNKKRKGKAWFKRATPLIGVGGIVGVFGIIVMLLTTPSLLIVQMKETMTNKFNTQLSSMDTRSNKLLLSKVSGATNGVCSTKIAIACKFASMKDKQIASLKKAGFTFEGETKGLLGRTTVTAMVFDGKRIDARNFNSTIATDTKVRTAFKASYNPKYAGFSGKAWAAVASKYKINKQAPDLDGQDPDKAKEKLKSITNDGMVDDTGAGKNVVAGEYKDPNCTVKDCATWTQADADAASSSAAALSAEGKSGVSGSKVRAAISDLSSKTSVGTLGATVKITGVADSACMAIGALNTLTYAAKAIRTLQLVRYMMVFSSVADSIKAGGNPKPEDVAYLGTILTTTSKNTAKDGTVTNVGSATDSFGYKYAAYNDSSASKSSMNIANRFMAGGGMVGSLSSFSNTIYGFFGDRATARTTASATCGVLANPAVQAGSLLIGAAALFVPGVNVGVELVKAGAMAAVAFGIMMIPSLLSDIVAGSVTNGIAGEESGNAIASGSGSLLSDSLAGQNGAAPMSKSDTLAYNNAQTETTNQYIADELQDTNPLDATNSNTFIGSIAASLLPLRSSSNPFASIGSLFASSYKSIVPTTKAASNEDYAKSLDVCQDADAQDGGFAVDPFCNVIRGIPPQYINKDPIEVAEALFASGDLNENGVPQANYAAFIKKCMTSIEPLGYSSGSEFKPDEAKDCVINDSNANYYLNYMDQRIELGMSGDDIPGVEEEAPVVALTDKKALAQKIVAKNKITYLGDVQPILDRIADGSVDADSEPCGININILRIIDMITDKHSIKISDINRHCTESLASSRGSRHFAGNGSAIDIAVIDGVSTNGRDANAMSIINMVMPLLSESAVSTGSFSQLGQGNCGATPGLGASVRTISDSCNHLHIDLPPKSDPTLKYDPSGW